MSIRRHVIRITTLAAAAASCAMLSACDSLSSTTGTGSSNTATVRFVNALTGGTGSLSLSVNGTAGSGVTFQQFGSCQSIPAGSTTFSFGPTGGSTALVSIPATTLSAGGHYTVIATGSASSPQFLVLNDAFTTPATGQALLRVINAVGTGTPFDVFAGTPGAGLGTTANASNVTFNTSQSFFTTPAGATQVQFTTPGTSTVLGSTGTLTLATGTPQTLVVTPASTVGGSLNVFTVPACP